MMGGKVNDEAPRSIKPLANTLRIFSERPIGLLGGQRLAPCSRCWGRYLQALYTS
jgi:hypothetical protein